MKVAILLKKHLFSTWYNGLLTVLLLILLYQVIPPLMHWMVLDANWVGSSKADCQQPGACWPFITQRFSQFMYGLYPEQERYRVNVAGLLLLITFAQWFIPALTTYWKAGLSIIITTVILVLLIGGVFGLPVVETALWGGLFLTIVLAFGSIVCSFPIALLLALGRQSSMPVTKSICVTFIEFVRGVPLITVLFMASVMLPMFLPAEINLDKLFRAFLGITLFQSAYLAEVIRGGLVAIPKGQYEAADALGLNYWQKMIFIILPQALKIVIPGIVNTFIGLFKDTSLVLIIGLLDFLKVVQTATQDSAWLGTSMEGYVFCAAVYWALCFTFSQYSRHLERKYHTGHKDELR